MKKTSIWQHAIIWIALYAFWIVIFQNRTLAVSNTLTVQFCYLAFVASVYYFTIYFLVPEFLYKKHYIVFVLLLLITVSLSALLRTPLAMYLNKHFFLSGKVQPSFQQIFTASLLNIFVWTICLVAATLIIEKIRFQKFLESLEKEKTKNELDFLKAQFNPHFLFNSINSIYGHIHKGNEQARKMLLTFSDMLRYQLYECNVDTIPIEKEINYIKNYVTLQKSRKEENLIIDFNIVGEVKNFCIAPMLIIAFIENAFKFVSIEGQENHVSISLRKEDNILHFECENTKEKVNYCQINDHKGIGMANVKRRLELLYPGHELMINDRDESYKVILKLPLK